MIIRKNFLQGLWNVKNVKLAQTLGYITQIQFNSIMHDGVVKGIITKEEYLTATGEAYVD